MEKKYARYFVDPIDKIQEILSVFKFQNDHLHYLHKHLRNKTVPLYIIIHDWSI
jgi:hypothetical protein